MLLLQVVQVIFSVIQLLSFVTQCTCFLILPTTTTTKILGYPNHNNLLTSSSRTNIKTDSIRRSSSRCYSSSSNHNDQSLSSPNTSEETPTPPTPKYKHTMAILTLPKSSIDNIANEAILETCMKHTTDKLSIVLRCSPDHTHSNFQPKINDLRRYVGEIYSMAWDVVLNIQGEKEDELLNVIIYPQNLPNAAPENWITHRSDLECICSHSSIIGWSSSTTLSSSKTGQLFSNVEGSGLGGLQSHVDAVNNERRLRGLKDVHVLEVEDWPDVCSSTVASSSRNDVLFLEDDDDDDDDDEGTMNQKMENESSIGHYRIPSSSLYNSVAVGGTFDGVHYGHRKLLTLAISSVMPNIGKLIIGITTDEMLQQKEYANYIPTLKERMKDVRSFVNDLAPGMKNRIKIVPIKDKYGPPGTDPKIVKDLYDGMENDFDALVLSHETLPTGSKLNEYRVKELGLKPLKLLCTRRTEAHGMSSTTLRRIRSQKG